MVVPGYLQKHSLSIASCGQTANTSSRSITPFFLVPIKRGGKRDSAFPHKCTISCAFGLIVFVALVSLSLSRQRQTNTTMRVKQDYQQQHLPHRPNASCTATSARIRTAVCGGGTNASVPPTRCAVSHGVPQIKPLHFTHSDFRRP